MKMKAQEVKALYPSGEVDDSGLIGVQAQPEWGQSRLGNGARHLGPLLRRTEHDPVVGVSNALSDL
jgi:hypothetical protein